MSFYQGLIYLTKVINDMASEITDLTVRFGTYCLKVNLWDLALASL